jgi:hypothetical protein
MSVLCDCLWLSKVGRFFKTMDSSHPLTTILHQNHHLHRIIHASQTIVNITQTQTFTFVIISAKIHNNRNTRPPYKTTRNPIHRPNKTRQVQYIPNTLTLSTQSLPLRCLSQNYSIVTSLVIPRTSNQKKISPQQLTNLNKQPQSRSNTSSKFKDTSISLLPTSSS